jgi:hypothetical protein
MSRQLHIKYFLWMFFVKSWWRLNLAETCSPIYFTLKGARVCGRSLPGIEGSNHVGDMDVCLLWVVCVRSLCDELIPRPEGLTTVVHHCAWSRNLASRCVVATLSEMFVHFCRFQNARLFWAFATTCSGFVNPWRQNCLLVWDGMAIEYQFMAFFCVLWV